MNSDYNDEEIVKVKTDVIFKKFFTDPDNEDLLRSFVAIMLGIAEESIKEIVILNPEMSPEEMDGKFVRLDLKILLNDKKIICMEIQLYCHAGFKERVLYYAAGTFGNQLKAGQPYTDIKETISIVITDFSLFKTTDYHSEFVMTDREHDVVLTDKFKIHFFEMSKLNKEIDESNMRQVWLQFLKADSRSDLDMIAATVKNPEIRKGVNVIYDYSSDATTREKARVRERAMHLEATMMQGAEEKGRAEGRKEGRKEGEAKGIVRMCKSIKMSIDEITAKLVDMLDMSQDKAREIALMYA